MALSDLIRWGGLAAASALSGSAGLVLALGLVGLYAHQAQEAGYLGLVGFLAAFIALWLGQENIGWAALLANVGWVLFGVAALGARTYPHLAAIVLIAGAALTGVVNLLLLVIDFGGTAPAYVVGVGALIDAIFYAGVGWLGISLFTGRVGGARRLTS